MVKTFNDNTYQDYSTAQGTEYLQGYRSKKTRFSNTLLGEGSLSAFDRSGDTTGVIEGFTGAFGPSKANIRNQEEAVRLDATRKEFDRAMGGYAGAQKQLMEEAQMFVNNSTNDGPASKLRGKLIRTTNGTVGYVTDDNTFKWVPNTDVLSSLYSKNGCPAQYEQVDLDISARTPAQGNVTGSDPNLFVGTPMKKGQSCAPSSVNIQVMGNTDPNFNKADWLGCYTRASVSGNFDQNSDLPNSDDPEMCRVRAADLGSSAFYINNSTCYTAKSGVSVADIQKTSQIAHTGKVSKVLFSTTSLDNGAAGILNNGQLALGSLPTNATNFGLNVQNPVPWSETPAIENCGAAVGGGITIKSATWGANCNGKVKPWTTY